MAVQTDFIAAVNQIAAERGIDSDEVLVAVSDAIRTGFLQNFPEDTGIDISVNINGDLGQISVVQRFTVVDKIENAELEMSVKDAKKLVPDVKVGDTIEQDITPSGDFGRVAAQSAKQVILQKIRESERETQLKAYVDKIGQVEYAVVQRVEGDTVIWEVGRATALMPQEDRIPGEFYRSGSRYKVLLKEIKETPKGKSLIVSRSDNGFLKALFELEVPELLSKSIEIKSIAREAGSRTKVAVVSNVDGIDPIGSFVGQKGIRINAVTNELRFDNREEKIDIILWDGEIGKFIANALSPASVKAVKTHPAENGATVIVPDDQLSLAIGKEGQNVRLAAKLTGWKIDIMGETESGGPVEDSSKEEVDEAEEKADADTTAEDSEKKMTSDSDEVSSLDFPTRIASALEKAGIKTVADLKKYSDDYTQIPGIATKSAETIAERIG